MSKKRVNIPNRSNSKSRDQHPQNPLLSTAGNRNDWSQGCPTSRPCEIVQMILEVAQPTNMHHEALGTSCKQAACLIAKCRQIVKAHMLHIFDGIKVIRATSRHSVQTLALTAALRPMDLNATCGGLGQRPRGIEAISFHNPVHSSQAHRGWYEEVFRRSTQVVKPRSVSVGCPNSWCGSFR